MYLALKAGKTSLLNRAQWLQLAEAYSTTFTLASAGPRLMSPALGPPAPLLQPARLSPATAAATRRMRRLNMGESLKDEETIKARFPTDRTLSSSAGEGPRGPTA